MSPDSRTPPARTEGVPTNREQGNQPDTNGTPEQHFYRSLTAAEVPIFSGPEDYRGLTGWQTFTSATNDGFLMAYGLRAGLGWGIMAGCGGPLAVVDVDPRNGGHVGKVRTLLADLNVRIFAEVETGGGGGHFYVAGHEDISTSHGIEGWPGVDVQSAGANVFLPGTLRTKHEGRGYRIVLDDLDALADGGDPDGAEQLAGWLAERMARKHSDAPLAPVWDGPQSVTPYLRAVLAKTVEELGQAAAGTFNNTLNYKAFQLGQYVAGAGLPLVDARQALEAGCTANDGKPADRGSLATINSGLRSGQTRPKAQPEPGRPPVAPMVAVEPPPTVAPTSLADCHAVFSRWLGDDYDVESLDAMLAAAAVEKLDGDPLWLLLISGSGNAKTETVQALDGSGAIVTSTIASEGALLSATSAKERTKDATGGLLRKVGPSGVIVIKDMTSVLSMSRDARGLVLGALREVYDGRWSRNVGVDGGRTLEWLGRIVVIGAVTTAWDRAHDVIASMGDRFVLLRMDSGTGRQAAGRKAIGNTGHEIEMRAELAAAVAGVLAGVDPTQAITLTDDETDLLLSAADVVTRARTGVDYDYRGDVIDAHAPEMPTRFAKQLAQVVRGAVAVGMSRPDALRLAVRCARDSMPPLRLAILDDVAAHPLSATRDVRRRLAKPRATIDRQLQALHMLDVLDVSEEVEDRPGIGAGTVWRYLVASGIDVLALDPKHVPDLALPPPKPPGRGVGEQHPGPRAGLQPNLVRAGGRAS